MSTINNTDPIYYHAFNLLPQIGARRLAKILRYFKNAETAWRSSPEDLRNANLEQPVIESILSHRGKINLDEENNNLSKHQINLLTWGDVDYPQILKELPDAPPLLYYKGTLPPQDSLMIAVVGTRKITGYGKIVAPMLTKPLAQCGCVIVSGLAYGIDAAAHSAVLESGGKTLAVLGGGLDDASLYPKDHGLLAQRIIDSGGCVMSEYPQGTPAMKGNFVARNRIVSGLSSATIVIECDLKSGALITARFALEQNRLVFAVPGPITSQMSEGTNRLIQQGARPLLNANEVLMELNLTASGETNAPAVALPKLNTQENIVLQFLDNEPRYPDELVHESGLSASQVTTALGMLELKGVIRNLGANQYVSNL